MGSARPSRSQLTGSAKTLARIWWRSTEKHKDVFGVVHTIREQSRRRREEDRHHMRLYANLNVAGSGWTSLGSGGLLRGSDGRMRYNLCSSAVDTAVSIVAQQRPRPMFLTVEGDWSLQRQARQLTQVIEGQLHDLGMYEMGSDIAVNMGVDGTAFVFGYLDRSDPKAPTPKLERCLLGEWLVDHNEGIYREPRGIYRRRLIARDVLCELYPKFEKEIREAAGPSQEDFEDFWLSRRTTSDLVVVCEAWHLRSSKNSKDGRHVITVSSATLIDEEWKLDRFPVAVFRWQPRQLGYYGQGIVEQCRDAQWRINQLIRKRENLSDLGSNARLLVHGDSKVRVDQITNEPMKVIRWWGAAPPEVDVTSAVPGDLQQEIEQIKTEKFQELGLSSMQLAGEKPAGLDSGKAIRAYEDVGSRRQQQPGRRYEDGFMDVCDLLLELNMQAAEINPDYQVSSRKQVGRTTLLSSVKWREVALPENKYRLQMWPTSSLPSTPAGKMAAVQEWVDGGWISRPFAQSLLDFPDIDSALRIELADLDAIMFQIEQILDGKKNVLPDGYMDLVMAADIARRSLLHARTLEAPAGVLLAMEDYIDEAMQLTEESAEVVTAPAAIQQPPANPSALPAAPPAVPLSGGQIAA